MSDGKCNVTIAISFPNQKKMRKEDKADFKPKLPSALKSLDFTKIGSTLPIKAEEKVKELI